MIEWYKVRIMAFILSIRNYYQLGITLNNIFDHQKSGGNALNRSDLIGKASFLENEDYSDFYGYRNSKRKR